MAIGPHRLTNASVDDSVVRQMLTGSEVSILYCDPPWGEGMAKYFKTLAERMTGTETRQITCKEILENILDLAVKNVRGHVFIEYGCRWEAELVGMCKACLFNVRVFRRAYHSGSRPLPQILVYGGTSSEWRYPAEDPVESDNAVNEIISIMRPVAQSGAVVLDPCCGMGNTAKAAVALGMRFFGNEFNMARLEKTAAFLRRHGNTEA